MPKVSIIIPNYNNSKYLAGCINSVRMQSYQDTEIVVIDDCSKDNSEEIVKEIAAVDSRIVFQKMPKNSGVGAARNRGIDLSSGEFIIFLDSDDIMCPTAIDGMMTIQAATGADIIVGSYTKVPESFFIPEGANFTFPAFDFESFAEPNAFVERIDDLSLVTVWGKMIRREIVKDIRFEEIYPYEDVEFILRLYGHVHVGAITKNLAIYYRLSETSVIADKTRDVSKDVIKVLESIAANFPKFDKDYAKFVKRYAYMFLRLWIGSILRKMNQPNADRAYRRRLGRQMRSMAKCVRHIMKAGVFNGIRISSKNKIALILFGIGFTKPAGKVLAFKDGKI